MSLRLALGATLKSRLHGGRLQHQELIPKPASLTVLALILSKLLDFSPEPVTRSLRMRRNEEGEEEHLV